MLYYLCPYLCEYLTGFNILRYISFRSICAAITAFLITVLFTPVLIKWLRDLKIQEGKGKDECPPLQDLHNFKKGTPTMGGIFNVAAVLLSTLIWGNLSGQVNLAMLALFGFGCVGFADDLVKLRQARSGKGTDGLRRGRKLILQLGVGFLIACYLYTSRTHFASLWNVEVMDSNYLPFLTADYATKLAVPFDKNLFIEMGWMYIPFAILVVVGSTNAVNITDGIDGLAVGSFTFVALVFGLISYFVGNWKISQYLNILFVDGGGELAVFCASMVGACLGFLWYNCYPEEVFMGDTGSLALGGAIGVVALIVKHEILLVLAGGVFVVETISVILQILFFKLEKKRVFRIAPMHHIFELRGLKEPKVVLRLLIVSAILALLSLGTLKIR